ncbi:MAG: hypothetical protein CMP59_09660 [Flavobacteriales bacterium]|nr:hypothetical protein [Flavobacteriales bacterium]|tara:strand:+ start:615 stop:1409 length:795 start_codon:yes stop_codon:yes gene_type:complete
MKGTLSKMPVKYADPVQYFLKLEEEPVLVNDWIGKTVKLSYTGNIYCINCGRKTSKSFNQGFCFPCFRDAPQNAECIIRPELCRAHLGEGRDPEWEEKHHNQPHVVYLAISSVPKVGVTRATNVPSRWIDQGAWKAVKLAETPNRYQAGMIETDLKQYFSDKTPWQRMLKNELADEVEVLETKNKMQELMEDKYNEFDSSDDEIYEMKYPVIEFPTKVKSHNLDKEPTLEGKLMGIKGQYWIFEGGIVINIRKYGGYEVELLVH